ncbi:hypothetical protein RND81_13G023100 [Saponaria officinalis]|uniref:Fe2OG dioxygenase domain-containing protein n=1 Tax=Saponaria officinalis TaxID=3572 RepID=A0AAW1GT26_SAPOF
MAQITQKNIINIDDGIPTIDLSSITSLDHLPNTNDAIIDRNMAKLVTEVGDACEKWGIFRVINHGVPLEILESARKFFALSKEDKMKASRDETCPMGYSDEAWKQVFEFCGNESVVTQQGSHVFQVVNRWPESPAELREAAQEYGRGVEKLGLKILELIALSLGLDANRLTEFHKDTSLSVRLHQYAPRPDPEAMLEAGTHTDTGCVTVLAQDDIGGLEVKRKNDGEWIALKPVSGALTINIGDIVQVWSNDKYHSVVHRVRPNTTKERLSIASLFGPAYYVNVKPLDELINDQNCAKYREYNWGVFRASRMKNYGNKQSLERQEISHFRIIKT